MKCEFCEEERDNFFSMRPHLEEAHYDKLRGPAKARVTRRRNDKIRAEKAQHMAERGLAVSRLVIRGYGDVPYPYGNSVVQLSTLDKWEGVRARYPDPEVLKEYDAAVVLLRQAEESVRRALLRAYQLGTRVLPEDWEKIQAVMEAVV